MSLKLPRRLVVSIIIVVVLIGSIFAYLKFFYSTDDTPKCVVTFASAIPEYSIGSSNTEYLCNLLESWGVFSKGKVAIIKDGPYEIKDINLKEIQIILTNRKQNYFQEVTGGEPIWSSSFSIRDDVIVMQVFVGERVLKLSLDEVSNIASSYIVKTLYKNNSLLEKPIDKTVSNEAFLLSRQLIDEGVSFFTLTKI